MFNSTVSWIVGWIAWFLIVTASALWIINDTANISWAASFFVGVVWFIVGIAVPLLIVNENV